MKVTINLILISIPLLFLSCKKDKTTDTDPSSALKKAAIDNYANIVYANYSDALEGAKDLQVKIDLFVQAPDAQKFEECKDAWLAARIPYNQTDAYRFYNGPIDDANGPEGLLNAWPLDEVYIDYVNGNSTSGIINDGVTTITVQNIADLNQATGETNVSTGYHAIEFLLWGQDLQAVGTDAGQRPYTDYLTAGGTATNQARRAQYLKACAALLVDNLQELADDWSPTNAFNYRAAFVSGNHNDALKKIIQGMGFFSKGELAGERMAVALEEQLQEHEHSCFSDNTHNDIRYGSKGIQNVFFGIYKKTNGVTIKGTGIVDVIANTNATLANQLATTINSSVTKCYAIEAPFDQQILAGSPGRTKIQTAINSLRSQADLLVDAVTALGLGNITVQ